MRTGELIAAVVVGALLLAVGYELGRAGRPEQTGEQAVDAATLERQIRERLEDKMLEREQELAESVISRVEELLSGEAENKCRHMPEVGNTQVEEGESRVKRLEREFDDLLARTEAELERKRSEEETKAQERNTRRREPFSTAELREFEEARRRMLEERQKLQEEEERRAGKRR